MTLTWELRPSKQTWRSDIREAKYLMQDRGLKTHSLGMPFPPPRKIAFPASCVLRVTHG